MSSSSQILQRIFGRGSVTYILEVLPGRGRVGGGTREPLQLEKALQQMMQVGVGAKIGQVY